jgi:hypothetical protein
VRLTVDPVGEIECVGVAVHTADPEIEGPESTWSVANSGVDRNRTEQRSGRGVESVDLTIEKAEIANQQVAAKRPKPAGASATPLCASWFRAFAGTMITFS